MNHCAASVSVTAAEQIPCMLVFLDADGRIKRTNSRFLDFMGYSSDELSGRPLNFFYFNGSEDHKEGFSWPVPEFGEKWSRDALCVKKDGTQFACHFELSRCTLEEDGQVKYITVCTELIPEGKGSEPVQDECGMPQHCLEIAGVFILMLDREFKVRLINRKGCRLLGMEKEEVLGLGWIDCFLPERERQLAEGLLGSIFEGNRKDDEFFQNVVLCEKGSVERVFIWHSSLLRDEAGTVSSVLLSGEDITEMKELDRMKSELMNIVSHEIRTPLASIRGFSELMLNRTLEPEKNRRYLLTINKEAERLSKFVDDFLDIQRIENSGNSMDQMLKLERFDIGTILDETAVIFEPVKTHKLVISRAEGGAFVNADYDKIRRLITNLVSNAYKYSLKSEPVFLNCEVIGENIRVTVIDKGLGVPEEAIPQLFSKFYRVDTLLHRKVTGTGLGLAICKSIVEAHKGRIWVESKVNEGSRFIFELPRVEHPI